MTQLEVCVLGPVAVRVGGEVHPVSGNREAAVLAALALNAPRPVSVDTLGDAVWGDAPPRTFRKTLQGFVHRLRHRLDPDLVETVPGGYRLGPGVVVDADRLVEQADLAARHRADVDHAGVERATRAGLDLVRGPAYPELTRWEGSAPDRNRVDEVVLLLEEWWLEARVAGGDRGQEQVAEAERLVAADPLREHRWLVLIRALVAADRPAEALGAYERAQRTLIDQLGAVPGPELQAEYRQVLELTARPRLGMGPSRVPRPVSRFQGRRRELADVEQRLARSRLVTIVGPGGAGKTRLAIEATRRHHERSGVPTWFVDVDGVTTIGGLTGLVNEAVVGSPAEESAAAVDQALGDGDALLVVDNAEHLVDELTTAARLWLEGSPGLRVLVTSRYRLPTADADVVSLGPMTADDAARFFTHRVHHRVGSDVEVDPSVATAICRAVDNLPLAIELAAARSDLVLPADLLAELTGDPGRSRLLAVDAGRSGGLAAAIESSYQLLTVRARRLLHRLTILEGDVGVDLASGLGGGDPAVTEQALRELLDRSLVDLVDADRRRFRVLNVIRDRVIEGGRAETDRREAEAALLHYWDERADTIWDWVNGDRHAEAIALLDRDQAGLRLALRLAAERDPRLAVTLITRTDDWWRATSRTLSVWRWLEPLVDDDRVAADPELRFEVIRLAVLHGSQSLDVDREVVDRLVDLLASCPVPDRRFEVELLEVVARFDADAPEIGRRLELLVDWCQRANSEWLATALDFHARWLLTNDAVLALERARQCRDEAQRGDNLVSIAHAQEVLGAAHLVNGEVAEATSWLRRATGALAAANHPGCLLHCYETVAWLAIEQGREAEASELLAVVAALRDRGRRRRLPIEWTGYRLAVARVGAPSLEPNPGSASEAGPGLDLERQAAGLAARVLSPVPGA